MPMMHAETVKAVQELLQRRGIEQRPDERLGDYVARGLGVSGGQAEAFLEALHRGCTIDEAQRIAHLRQGSLCRVADTIGRMLGKIARQISPRAPLHQKKKGTGLSGVGATEDQVNMTAQVPQRLDTRGTKAEDLAGVGTHDSQGG